MLGRKLSTDEYLLSAETFLEFIATWLSEYYFSYRDAKEAVLHYHGEILTPQGRSLDAASTSPDYYFVVDGELHLDLANLTAADEPLQKVS